MSYVVPGMTLIPQRLNTSCWYASAQMLIQWKCDRFKMSMANLVPPEFDKECMKIHDGGAGLNNPQIVPMAKRLGLKPVPPMSPSPQAIESWLQLYGPLWVNGKTHIVVIAGIEGADSVKVYDPWPKSIGKIDWRSLTTWYVGGKHWDTDVDSSRDASNAVDAVFLHCP